MMIDGDDLDDKIKMKHENRSQYRNQVKSNRSSS